MFNKNYNTLISSIFMKGSTSATTGIVDKNNNEAALDISAFKSLSTVSDSSQMLANQNGVFLFTDQFEKDIETYTTPEEFTDYTVVNTTGPGGASSEVSLMYSRTIIPTRDVVIKSIGLLASSPSRAIVLFGFDNLPEPVKLKTGEPHTVAFISKVANPNTNERLKN